MTGGASRYLKQKDGEREKVRARIRMLFLDMGSDGIWERNFVVCLDWVVRKKIMGGRASSLVVLFPYLGLLEGPFFCI